MPDGDEEPISLPSFGGLLEQFAHREQGEAASIPATPRRSPLKRTNIENESVSPVVSPSKRRRGKSVPVQTTSVGETRQVTEWKPLLRPGLRCVFVGFNPGTVSMAKGHYYAHHSNLFWKLIYESGIVNRKVTYEDDVKLQDEAGIGFTDLVSRSTAGIKDLAPNEFSLGVPILEERLSSNSPGIVVIVGKGIWEAIYQVKRGKKLTKDFSWGLQPMKFAGCRIYVVPSTSGLVGGIPRTEKLRLWKELARLI